MKQKEVNVEVKVKEKLFLNLSLNPGSLFFIFIMLSSFIFALDPDKKITQYVQQVWGIKEGLPQNSVYAVIQTHDGYLWLGIMDNGDMGSGNLFLSSQKKFGLQKISTGG